MTVDEAREHIGHAVSYRPFADVHPERGVITGVEEWPLVRFGNEKDSQAVEPWCLTLEAKAP